MKPRIKLINRIGVFPVWFCTGAGSVGSGGTPQIAFKNWKWNKDFAASMAKKAKIASNH